MSFADPQSVTVSGSGVSLPRTSAGVNSSTYTSADGLYVMQVSHSLSKRSRRLIKLSQAKLSADPIVPAQNVRSSMSVSLVVDVPNTGYTVAEEKAVVDALVAYLAASSGAQVTKLLGGEN